MPSPSITAPDASVRVRRAVESAKAPISLKALAKQTRVPHVELKAILAADLETRAIFRWPEVRGQQRFWVASPDAMVRDRILAVGSECAVPASALAAQVKKRMPAYPVKLIVAAVQQLLRDKELRKYRSFGRGGPLLGREGHIRAYAAAARHAIAGILGTLSAAGAGPEDLSSFHEIAVAGQAILGVDTLSSASRADSKAGRSQDWPPREDGAAVSNSSVGTAILNAMARIEPSHTAPVSLLELRAALPHVTKQALDQAALALRRERRIFLSQHDFPQGLSPEDRASLIDGQDGAFYVAITLRGQ